MKLNWKQKEFKRLYKYTIVNMNGVTVKLKNDGECIAALPDEIATFILFKPKGFWIDIKTDFVNIGEIIRLKHYIFRKWQFKVLCDSKSKLHNGRKYYVLTDLNGDYRVVNREEFKMLKNRGLISKHANFLDLMKEAVHISPDKKK
jgi:hypothetical protein